jgi:hypothetical protein
MMMELPWFAAMVPEWRRGLPECLASLSDDASHRATLREAMRTHGLSVPDAFPPLTFAPELYGT